MTTQEEKKQLLFLKQKATLDKFLERNAISQEQYEKSLSDMEVKMFGDHKIIAKRGN